MTDKPSDSKPKTIKKPKATTDTQDEAQRDPNENQKLPIVEPPPIQRNNDDHETNNRNCYRHENRNFIFLIIATVTAIAAAIFTGWQVLVARNQLKISRETAISQQRAYVYAVPAGVYHLGGSPTQGYVTVRNGGQSFARKVKRTVGINVLGPNLPDEFSELGRTRPEPGVIIMGPDKDIKDKMYRTYRPILKDDQISKIKNGELRIYVFGKITYVDMFNNPHLTVFCFMYFGGELAGRGTGKPDGYRGDQGEYCNKHNDAN